MSHNATETWPRAAIWDLDGTLIDSAPDLANILNQLLLQDGIPPLCTKSVVGMVGAGARKLVERGYRAAGSPLAERNLDSRFEHFVRLYSETPVDTTRLYPGVRDCLQHLRDEGIRQAVCTNKPHAITADILDRLGVSSYFKTVIGGDSVATRKPDPAPVLACLERLGCPAGDAVMIGDSDADVGAASAAGVRCLFVTYGYCDVPLATLRPDAACDRPTDIPDALRRLA